MRAARALVEHHQLLALLEPPENRRHRANVCRLRRDLEQMRQQAADLAVEHANELRPTRNRNSQEPLDRERVGVLLVHRRDVVEPVEIGHVLQIGACFHQLLGAAMQEADMRIDAFDHLAVEFEHESQHAVRRWVLRPEVDQEVAEVRFGHEYGSAAVQGLGSRRKTIVPSAAPARQMVGTFPLSAGELCSTASLLGD
jgi:hypothetical protein